MLPIASPVNDSRSFWQSKETHYSSIVYEMTCSIFRVLAMTFQYAVIRLIAEVRHLRCFPSALPSKKLIAVSRNISNLNVLQTCLKTAWIPERKDAYQGIGNTQGLRVTHDIVLRPASGICLGKSLTFLSEYRLGENETVLTNLKVAAEQVEGMGNETCVRMQAIYDALIGCEGQINSHEKDLFLQILQGKHISNDSEIDQGLLASIKAFLAEDEPSETLRHFVLSDLESQGAELTPHLYALILELDTFWHLQLHPGMRKNDSAHLAILQAVAHCINLEPVNAMRLQGPISTVCSRLEEMGEGSFLIHFANHTIACVKEQNCLALFDPNEGLACFDEGEQKDGITQLLEFYGSNQSIALHLTEIY